MNQDEIDEARAEVEASFQVSDPQASSFEQSKNAIQKVIQDTEDILVSATTIAPIHKSTITLNRVKLFTVEHSSLGNIASMSVRIEDVLNVNGEIGPVSGFVKIYTKFTPADKPYSLGPFHRKDVLKIKRIIQGYIIALDKKIDVGPIPTKELIKLLYELGIDDQTIN